MFNVIYPWPRAGPLQYKSEKMMVAAQGAGGEAEKCSYWPRLVSARGGELGNIVGKK